MFAKTKKQLWDKGHSQYVNKSTKKYGTVGIKRVAPVAAMCCAGLLIGASSAKAQTLTNAGFESPYNTIGAGDYPLTGNVASGWFDNNGWKNPRPTVTYSQDTAEKHGGSSSQKMVVSSGTDVIYAQEFTPQSGKAYAGSIWLKAATSMNVSLEFVDKVNYTVRAKRVWTVDNTWRQYKISSSDLGTNNQYWYMRVNSTGTLWLDDASLANTNKATASVQTKVIPSSMFGIFAPATPGDYNPNFTFHGTKIWVAWEKVEASKGTYSWVDEYGKSLDTAMDSLVSRGIEPIIIFGSKVPSWAKAGGATGDAPIASANIQNYKNFVDAALNRYGSKCKYYAPWNEPNTNFGGSATIDDVIAVMQAGYERIKAKNASFQVVGPMWAMHSNEQLYWDGFDNDWGTPYGLSQFFEKGGAAYLDIVAVQQYQDPPENALPYINGVRDILSLYGVNKPLWMTESGFNWGNNNYSLQDADLGKVLRSYLVHWASGYERMYMWYWQGGKAGNATSAGYDNIRRWLVGATMTSFSGPDANGVYKAELTRSSPNGYKGYILWKASGSATNYSVPSAWGITRVRSDLINDNVSFSSPTSVSVSTAPQLLENMSPNLMSNPSFDAESYDTQTPSGWSSAQWDASWNSQTPVADYTEANGGSKSGSRHGTHWNSNYYRIYTFQTKSNLTNGLYTLRAWVKSSGGQNWVQMEAKDHGNNGSKETATQTVSGKSLKSSISSYELVEIKDINVNNGSCTVGFYTESTGAWLYFDDVEFVKQ